LAFSIAQYSESRKHIVPENGSVSVLPSLKDTWPLRKSDSLPSPEDGNRSSFRNAVFSSYLEFRALDKGEKPSDSEE
jgi:hypothetical protein